MELSIKINLILLTTYITCLTIVNSQLLDNKSIVDQSLIESIPHDRVETFKSTVVKDILVLQEKTNIYVGAKLKQNLFKALRVLAEKELEGYPNAGSNHKTVLRQEEEVDEDDDTDESTTTTAASTTTLKSEASTTAKSTNIAPVVATFVKAIFGGHNAVNLTSYVQGATRFLPQAVGNQILGVVRLIASNPNSKMKEITTLATSTTTTTTEPTTTTKRPTKPRRRRRTTTTSIPELVTSVTEIQLEEIPNETTTSVAIESAQDVASTLPTVTGNSTNYNTTAKAVDEEEEEEEENEAQFPQNQNFGRQLKLPDFNDGLNFLGALVLGVTPKSSGSKRRGNVTTTESPSGFEEEPDKKEGLDLTGLATGIRMGLGDLVKVVPDLFKGAREAVGLLSGIQSLLSGFNIGS